MNIHFEPSPVYLLTGFNLIVRPIPYVSVQARRHHKRRVDKKWRRRYGFKRVPGKYDPGEVLVMGHKIYVFPEMRAIIEERIKTAVALVGAEAQRDAEAPPPLDPPAPVTIESVREAMGSLNIKRPRAIVQWDFRRMP